MRIRRLELSLIALTLAFACFTGGYFVGRKGAVNVVALAPQQDEHITAAAQLPPANQVQEPLPSAAGNEMKTAVQIVNNPDEANESAVQETQPQDGGTQTGAPQVGAPKGGDGRININTASRGELTDLPGIGDTLAGRIIDYRLQHGPFIQVEDIRGVSGIGEKRYEAIKELIAT